MSEPAKIDPACVAGKSPPITEATDLLIVGAGPAGLAAALAAAGRGARVTLVDENPVPLRIMGSEIPLHFGGRMAATVSNRNAVLETILQAQPRLVEALEAGVDVRLGTLAWGLFPRRSTTAWIDAHVVGLADEDRAYLMSFKQVIVAAGRRDMGLAFDGWQLPGVMGASAAYRLAMTYSALETKTALLVGSDAAALLVGNALSDAGIQIAAIVEQGPAVIGPADLLARLVDRGARVLTRQVVERAQGDRDGVAAVHLAALDEGGRRDTRGPGEMIRCDTVLLGVEVVPAIELLESAGCAVGYDARRGGHVPVLESSQRTSLPFVHAVGDCAGVWPAKVLSESIAVQEGRVAAVAALQVLGLDGDSGAVAPAWPDAGDPSQRRLDWVRASVLESPARPFVCQCEEVTAEDILSLHPPRYLNVATGSNLAALDPEVPPSPDAVKRLTRAGMGPCQGRRCREQVAALIALGCGCPLAAVPLATYRVPVRPLTLQQLAEVPESAATGQHWDSWFGMPSQWVPFWRLEPAGDECE